MTDERRSASAAAGNPPPLATASGSTPPFSIWALLALGACGCIGWLSAITLDY